MMWFLATRKRKSSKHQTKWKHTACEWTEWINDGEYLVNDLLVHPCWVGTCLTISVLSLQGVEPASLSPSSWTIMVFTDSVSPLLSLEELQESRRTADTLSGPYKHSYKVKRLSTYMALESSGPEVDSSPAPWSTSSSSSSSVVSESSLEDE